ncbi:TPA: SOS response-associated peptidase [Pseudomonas aeruginosa]
MCSHYEAPSSDRILAGYGVAPAQDFMLDLWPCNEGPFLRRRPPESVDDGDSEIEALIGQFGLLPFWAKDRTLGRSTYNARSETASTKNSFRAAWRKAQHCVIPAAAFYEPDWRSGKAVPTRITRTDGGVMSLAGLWEEWSSPEGRLHYSYSMLTINADDHPLMRNFHKPNDERRSVVILPAGVIQDWLRATPEQSMEFMRPYPADRLHAEAANS